MRTRLLLVCLLAVAATSPLAADGQDAPAEQRKVVSRVVPLYPDLARRMQLQGKVKLEVMVAANGTVKSTKVIGGNPVLVAAAETAIKKWRFEPAGAPSSELVELTFIPHN
jgi:TonB family protein